MKWKVHRIAMASLIGTVAVGLLIANERRRSTIILQNREVAQYAERELADLRHLGFLDRDMPMQSTHERLQAANTLVDLSQKKWWMISIKTDEAKAKLAKLKCQMKLNHKLLESYRRELNDLRRFGFPENDPQVVYSRNRVAQTVVEIAQLNREYRYLVNKQEPLTEKQIILVQKMINLNQDSIGNYKAEIEEYFKKGLDCQNKKICQIRSKIAVKMAENSILERKLHR